MAEVLVEVTLVTTAELPFLVVHQLFLEPVVVVVVLKPGTPLQ
jgi:hypothetical protein